MPLKTSFSKYFNATLFRKNLTRFWPLWAVPAFLGAMFPMVFLTEFIRHGSRMRPVEVTAMYYEVVQVAVPILSLIYAVLVAVAVWSYLFNHRSISMMHTLPLRREGLFLTGVLSGLTMMLIPYVITGVLSVVVFSLFGGFNPGGILVTVACIFAESLFYFGSATLVAFLTGNAVALPLLYFVFHFLAVAMDWLVNVFASGFIFGLSGNYTGVVEFLSPTVYLLNHIDVERSYSEAFVSDPINGYATIHGIGYMEQELTGVTLEHTWLIAVYALVGVALLGGAYLLYRKARSEAAGDVIALRPIKPVFRYGVTVCGALAGGLALYAVFWGQFQSGEFFDPLPLAIAMIVAGAISYYAASMMLAKTLRVFRGSWKGLGATALCVAAICSVMYLDLFGVETRVPALEQVETVTFRAADNNYQLDPVRDAALLEEVRAVHRAIAEDADYITRINENWKEVRDSEEEISRYHYVRLTYRLKNGTEVERQYHVPMSRTRMAQGDTYDALLDQLVNGEAMKRRRLHLDDGFRPHGGHLWMENLGEGFDLSDREAATILEAIGRDMENGSWGNYAWFDRDDGNRYAVGLDLEFQTEQNGVRDYDYISILLWPEMKETVACLQALDLVNREDLKTYAELYPQNYASEITTDAAVWEKYG